MILFLSISLHAIFRGERGRGSINPKPEKTNMLNTIQEATEVSLNAYNNIEVKEIGKENRDQFRFLGQCLTVLTEQLQVENDRLSRTEQP
jgi:hypothetical protein